MDIFMTLLLLSLYSIGYNCSISKGLYKRYVMEGAKWPKLMYLTAEFNTDNLIECGSVCQSEYTDECDLYSVKSKSCHIGKFTNVQSHLATQDGTNAVYVNIAKLLETMQLIYSEISQVDETSKWSKFIYKSIELAATDTFLDCSFYCNIVESDKGCELFMFHDTICYLGKTSFTEGLDEDLPLNITIYADQPGIGSMSSTFGEKLNVVPNHWKTHVEEVRSGLTQSACDALAFLEIWDYSAYDSVDNTCFLAKLKTDQSVEVSIESELRVIANLEQLNTFRDETFTMKESNIQGSFIYQSFDGTKNTQHCSIHCYFDPDDKCDYHYIYGSTCYLGSFTSDNYVGGPNYHVNTYIYKDNVKDSNAKLFTTTVEAQRNKWMRHIKETLDVVSEAECAAHAALYMHGPIDFYFYEEFECYIGDLAHVGGEGPDTDSKTLRVRQSNALSHVNSKYNIDFWLPGYIWNRYVIQEKVTFEDSNYAYKDCGVRCDLHPNKCDFFIQNDLDCYFATYSSEDDGSLIEIEEDYKSYHQKDPLNNYVDSKFWTWSVNVRHWAKFIYHKFHSSARQRCAFYCIYDDQCDFYVHWNSHCWRGNMTTTSGHSLTTTESEVTIYFRNDQDQDNGFINANFDQFTGNVGQHKNAVMMHTYWKHNIFQTVHDPNPANCARRCITSWKYRCNFYIHHADHCQLGDYNSNNNYGYGLGDTTQNTIYYQRKDTSVHDIISYHRGSDGNGDCWDRGYHYQTNANWNFWPQSDSFPGYRNNFWCKYIFYVPYAKGVHIEIIEFLTFDASDVMYIYIGAGTGSYRLDYRYGDAGIKTWSWVPTRLVTVYWSANSKDTELGFKLKLDFYGPCNEC